MPTHEKGNIWTAKDISDHILFTGNSLVTNAGNLVMGRGMAAQVKKKFPDIPGKLGRHIRGTCGSERFYGLLFVNKTTYPCRIGAFQVKTHWREKASLRIIQMSVAKLAAWCEKHPNDRVDMNFPGIGNGRLKKKNVEPLLEDLPDTVHIWTYK